MPALRLSYLNLPVKLRQCFSFCALFPKDEKISKKLLTDLWMANDIISSNEGLEIEDVGNEVCNELYWRSFFQDIEKDVFGKIENFKMHDLVHDLAQSIAEEVCCITEPRSCERIRHLSIYGRRLSLDADAIQLHGINSLRTFVKSRLECTPPDVLKCYSLRVLDFQRVKGFPSSICRLKYLRYLNLSEGNFTALPKSICKLSNLVILKLDGCYNLQKLPNSLVQLKTLQHLSLNSCHSLLSLPPHTRVLAALITLTLYVVGTKIGFHLGELRQLNLKGDLYIKHMERVKNVMSAKEANMSSKYINNLQLSWERNEESQLQENVMEILEVLQPQPQQLESLAVVGYTGAYFPQWISSPSLKYLTCLQLVDCQSCLELPHLGKLPSLKMLTISEMSHVKYLYEESSSSNGGVAGGFTTLELLILKKLPNFVRLSREDRDDMFPCLSKLQITECPTLSGLPCLPSLSGLVVQGKHNQQLLTCLHKLSSLESLQFNRNDELTCFPDGMLRNLTSLKIFGISDFPKLEKFSTEISNINAIHEINITCCEKLKSLTDEVLQGLHSLKILRIGICQKFTLTESFKYLTCLEQLIIQSCSEIEGLHEGLQHMTALNSLVLSDLPNLASLPDWLGNLGLLHDIEIIRCPKLMCLPMSIERLKCLKRLSIHSCSELKKRCRDNTGEDWQKIAHIPCIVADDSMKTYGGGSYSYEMWLL